MCCKQTFLRQIKRQTFITNLLLLQIFYRVVHKIDKQLVFYFAKYLPLNILNTLCSVKVEPDKKHIF